MRRIHLPSVGHQARLRDSGTIDAIVNVVAHAEATVTVSAAADSDEAYLSFHTPHGVVQLAGPLISDGDTSRLFIAEQTILSHCAAGVPPAARPFAA
jgi:hypothetical protein